jgi:hypothetical protein
MWSKAAARAFFLIGTIGFSLIFLALTVDTIRRVPDQTRQQNITPQVVQGKLLWEKNNCINWLQVLGTAELTQIDQRIGQHLHAIVPTLEVRKTEQQPFELIFPGKGAFDSQAQRMEGSVEQPLAPAHGALAVARILGDVGEQARIENTLPVPVGAFQG